MPLHMKAFVPFHFTRAHIRNRNNTGRSSQSVSRIPTYRLTLAPVKFLRKLDPVKLTVQALVNGAFQTSRCLSFPFCSPLFPINQCVEWVSGRKKLHLGKLPIFFFFFLFLRPLCCYFGICVYVWLLPFRLSSGCPRWRLACTCHATCAVAAARSRRAASALPSAPRTAAPRLHIYSRC